MFDRGYDFEGVVKWFAERADVILLFFDPDKPGNHQLRHRRQCQEGIEVGRADEKYKSGLVGYGGWIRVVLCVQA